MWCGVQVHDIPCWRVFDERKYQITEIFIHRDANMNTTCCHCLRLWFENVSLLFEKIWFRCLLWFIRKFSRGFRFLIFIKFVHVKHMSILLREIYWVQLSFYCCFPLLAKIIAWLQSSILDIEFDSFQITVRIDYRALHCIISTISLDANIYCL